MDPATAIATASSLIQMFTTAHNLSSKSTEEEKIHEALAKTMRKFMIFYEDMSWKHIDNDQPYKTAAWQMADEVQTIAIQAEPYVSEQIFTSLRSMATTLRAASSEQTPPGTLGGPSKGEAFASATKNAYSKAQTVHGLLSD